MQALHRLREARVGERIIAVQPDAWPVVGEWQIVVAQPSVDMTPRLPARRTGASSVTANSASLTRSSELREHARDR